MIAPVVGGALLMIDPSFPVYASIEYMRAIDRGGR